MEKSEVKVYKIPEVIYWQDEYKLDRGKVKSCLENWYGVHTVGEIADVLKMQPEQVVRALGELIDPKQPTVIIDSKEGEEYFQKVVKLQHDRRKFKITSETKFYATILR
jgi:hypothetical protein